jgi:AcrR family transcriptional regulator
MTVIDLTSAAPADGSAERRVVDAALRCVGRWGVAKTTLEDVAREAGYSRATVYRLFPGGKENLFEAVASSEVERFFVQLAQWVHDADTLEDALIAGITYTANALTDHEALQYLLAYEPDVILPLISFAQADVLLRAVALATAPYLARFVGEDEAPAAAEWVARVVLSYTLTPADGFDMTDAESARRLVRTFVLPGLNQTVVTS